MPEFDKLDVTLYLSDKLPKNFLDLPDVLANRFEKSIVKMYNINTSFTVYFPDTDVVDGENIFVCECSALLEPADTEKLGGRNESIKKVQDSIIESMKEWYIDSSIE